MAHLASTRHEDDNSTEVRIGPSFWSLAIRQKLEGITI